MRFQVEWLPSAYADLAWLWGDHVTLRTEIREASDAVDRELRVDAHEKGVAIDNFRVVRIWPLLVLYAVVMDDMKVRVVQFRLVPGSDEVPS